MWCVCVLGQSNFVGKIRFPGWLYSVSRVRCSIVSKNVVANIKLRKWLILRRNGLFFLCLCALQERASELSILTTTLCRSRHIKLMRFPVAAAFFRPRPFDWLLEFRVFLFPPPNHIRKNHKMLLHTLGVCVSVRLHSLRPNGTGKYQIIRTDTILNICD